MIVAIILCDRTPAIRDDKSVYLLPLDGETVIERVTRTVLRGPFGGTVVVSAPALSAQIRQLLAGFAVQHVEAARTEDGPHAALREALACAESFRRRWEKAAAAASARFSGADESARPARQSDWARHRQSADVKIRGLARAFECDGVILFRGDRPGLTPELQAQVVDAFGRQAEGPQTPTRPFAQAVHAGRRGYPILMDLAAAREVAALPPATDFDAWLGQRPERVLDVAVSDSAVVAEIASAADFQKFRDELGPKP